MKETPLLKKINYEGDDLALSKDQILNILNQVENYWMQSPLKNAKRIMALKLFKGGISWTSKEDVEDIWKIMLKFIDELRYQNFITKGKDGAQILKLVKKSIAEEVFS